MRPGSSFALPTRYFPVIYALTAALGLGLALVVGLRLHFTELVRNHCRVYEYWPSISSTIGDFMPERAIWRFACCIFAFFHVSTSFLLYSHFNSALESRSSVPSRQPLVMLLADTLRSVSAMFWTYVASFEHLSIHTASFGFYIAAGLIFQILVTKLAWQTRSSIPNGRTSIRYKVIGLLGQTVCAAMNVKYFLIDHRGHCLPGGYSRASMCEWCFAAFNIFFDATLYYELEAQGVSIMGLTGRTVSIESPEKPLTITVDSADSSFAGTKDHALRAAYWEFTMPPHSASVWFADIYLSYFFWSSLVFLYQTSYFLPMVAMSFTPESAAILSPVAPCILAIPFVFRLMSPSCMSGSNGYLALYGVSLISMFHFDVTKMPQMKLLICGLGPLCLCVALQARLAALPWEAPATRQRLTYAVPLGLALSMILRIWNWSLDPITSDPLMNAAGLILGGGAVVILARHQFYAHHEHTEVPLGASLLTMTTGWLYGAMVAASALLLTAPGVIPRYVGLDPFPSGSLVVASFLLGVYLSSGTRGSGAHVNRALCALIVGILVLFYAATESNVMEQTRGPAVLPSTPAQQLDIDDWEVKPRRGSPTIAFCGGLLAVFCLGFLWCNAITLIFMHPCKGRRSAVIQRECNRGSAQFHAASFAAFTITALGSVYVVCHPFVPFGWMLRNRQNVVLIGMSLGIAITMNICMRKSELSASASDAEAPKKVDRGNRRVFIVLFLLLCAVHEWRWLNMPNATPAPPPQPGRPLTFAIWTIHFAYDNQGNDGTARMSRLLKKTDATVIGMLESDISRMMTGNRDILEYVREDLGYPYSDFGPTTLESTFGCAMMSKHPIVDVRRIVLPSPVGELACLIDSIIDVGGVQLRVFIGHFGNTQHVQDSRLQSQALGSFGREKDMPTVFLGYLTTHVRKRNYHYIVRKEAKHLPMNMSADHQTSKMNLPDLFRDIGYVMMHESGWTETTRVKNRFAKEHLARLQKKEELMFEDDDNDGPPDKYTYSFRHMDLFQDVSGSSEIEMVEIDEVGNEMVYPKVQHLARTFFNPMSRRTMRTHPWWDYHDRYCEYVLFKPGCELSENVDAKAKGCAGTQIQPRDWIRVHDVEDLSDTEIQIGEFTLHQLKG